MEENGFVLQDVLHDLLQVYLCRYLVLVFEYVLYDVDVCVLVQEFGYQDQLPVELAHVVGFVADLVHVTSVVPRETNVQGFQYFVVLVRVVLLTHHNVVAYRLAWNEGVDRCIKH